MAAKKAVAKKTKKAAKAVAPASAKPVEKRMPRTLEGCRKKIDTIDHAIIELLDQRASVAQRVGEIKHAQGRSMYDAGRHINKLNQISDRTAGVFPIEGLRNVFGEILSSCLALEEPQRIAFLGPEATFSHIAAVRAFGRSADFRPTASIPEIFQSVEKEWVQFGIVPIENSTGGVVHTTLDELMNSSLSICAEIHIPIVHHMMCIGSLEDVRKVATHPQILSQCRNWLMKHLPNAAQVEAASSGEGVKLARDDKAIAAIGPELASKTHGVPIRMRSIQDRNDNITRFLIVGHQSPNPSGKDKTSIMFSTRDEAGALDRLLRPFSSRGINLTKIESRPSRRRAWDYIFFVDMNGHMHEPQIQAALKEMKKHTTYLRVLGSYPMDLSAAHRYC